VQKLIKLSIINCVTFWGLSGCNSGSTTPSKANITYTAFNCPGSDNVYFPGISGIRQVNNSSDVYITGDYLQYGSPHAFLYKGPVLGGGVCNIFNYPSTPGVIDVTTTSLYGPDNYTGTGNVSVVGSYTTSQGGTEEQFGLLYQGASDGSTISGYTTLNPQPIESNSSVINTLGHSNMNGLVVGDYDTIAVTGKAFIYDTDTESYTELRVGLASTTAYGIWYNGGSSYTITGGYSNVNESGIDVGYLIDYDRVTHTTSNFESINYNQLPASVVGTHVEGITTDGACGYNLSADWQYLGEAANPVFVHVPRSCSSGIYGTPIWINFRYPGSSFNSANTVYQNNVLGLFQESGVNGSFGYVATIPMN
jgi:hypothetical protein